MRKDQELIKQFKKNADFEHVLSLMNEKLFESEQDLIQELPEIYPTIHIIGTPRSGTTLAVQQLAEGLPLGYINNLVAAFWKAPLFGIHLSKQLIKEEYHSNFQSIYGRTDSIQEPHEFGYFWNYHLHYDNFQQRDEKHEQSIEWNRLKLLLQNMCAAYGSPMLFKSFLYGFHATKAYDISNKSCFVYIRRELIDNALSILKMRKKYLGNIEKWASIKPKQYDELKNRNIYEQVVGQILFLEQEYFEQLKRIPKQNRLLIDYADLCEQPNQFIQNVHRMVNKHYSEFENGNELRWGKFQPKKYEDDQEVNRLKKAIDIITVDYPQLKLLIEARKNRDLIIK